MNTWGCRDMQLPCELVPGFTNLFSNHLSHLYALPSFNNLTCSCLYALSSSSLYST